MGLDPKQRGALRSGLEDLSGLTHDMEPCPGGEAFAWDTVVFGSAVDAGHAVADALEQVTCSFTVEPSPTPKPTPTPKAENAPGPVGEVKAAAGDGFIDLSWAEPADAGTKPVDAYQARCRADGSADWLPTQELPQTEHEAVVDDVDNGTSYACEVAAISEVGQGPWTPTDGSATPAGRPAAPEGVNADRGDQSAVVSVVAGSDGGSPIVDYHYECSADGGTTWQPVNEPVSASSSIEVTGLANGTEYSCRATAENATGVSALSPPRTRSRRVAVSSTATRSSAGSWVALSPPPRSPPPGTSSRGIATACGRTSPPTSMIPRPFRSAAGRARASRSWATRSRWTGAEQCGRPGPVQGLKSFRRAVGRRPHRRQGRRRRRGHRSGRRIPHPDPAGQRSAAPAGEPGRR